MHFVFRHNRFGIVNISLVRNKYSFSQTLTKEQKYEICNMEANAVIKGCGLASSFVLSGKLQGNLNSSTGKINNEQKQTSKYSVTRESQSFTENYADWLQVMEHNMKKWKILYSETERVPITSIMRNPRNRVQHEGSYQHFIAFTKQMQKVYESIKNEKQTQHREASSGNWQTRLTPVAFSEWVNSRQGKPGFLQFFTLSDIKINESTVQTDQSMAFFGRERPIDPQNHWQFSIRFNKFKDYALLGFDYYPSAIKLDQNAKYQQNKFYRCTSGKYLQYYQQQGTITSNQSNIPNVGKGFSQGQIVTVFVDLKQRMEWRVDRYVQYSHQFDKPFRTERCKIVPVVMLGNGGSITFFA